MLVVDDTPETLGFLTDTLDHAGFTVLIATDGDSALDLVDQITPDLVLMDAVMPGMNGFEACRRLKREKMLSHMPVIFMTGLTETEHVVEGLAAGGVDYVTKPIVVDELLARIRVHLANARVAHGTRAALDASGRFLLATDRRAGCCGARPRPSNCSRELSPARRTRRRICHAAVIAGLCDCAGRRRARRLLDHRSSAAAGNLDAESHRPGRAVISAD